MRIHRLFAILTLSVTGFLACEDGPTPPAAGGQEVAAARVEILADTVVVNQNTTVRVTARVLDGQGRILPEAPVTFRTIHGQLASVSEDGVLTGLRPGETQVTAASGSVADTVPVDVFGHPEGLLVGSQALGDRPFGVAVSRAGVVYVTRLDAARVSQADVSTRSFVGEVLVGSVPTGVAFHPDGQTAYVTNQWSGHVGVIDVSANQQVDSVMVSGDPFVTVVSASGDKLYITTNTNKVYVASTATRQIIDSVTVSSAPNGFALHPSENLIYVSSFFGGTVAEVDVTTDDVRRTFNTGGMPQGMVVSRDGTELYIANESGWLDVYALASGERVAQVVLASGGFGMALSPDQAHLYVGTPNAGKVQVVNIASRKIIHTIDVGGRPRRIAFTRHGGIAVVANEAGWVSYVR